MRIINVLSSFNCDALTNPNILLCFTFPYCHSMVFNQLAMILVGLTIFFPPGANSDPCPTGLVAVNVTSSADIENLTDVISCTGQGDFNVTWYSSLTLGQSISVHGLKNVTITGVAFPTIHGGLGDDNDGGAGGGTGIFSVSDRSTLSLNKMVLAGGKSENGAAVNLVSHSSLFVYDCNFTAHNASNGGETRRLPPVEVEINNSHVVRHDHSVLLLNMCPAGQTVDVLY